MIIRLTLRLIDWLEGNMFLCPYKKYIGIDCMGCGIQRSFIAFIKGNIIESFYLYPALIPIIFMFFFLVAHLIFQFRKGAVFLKYIFIFNVSVIIINFISKLVR